MGLRPARQRSRWSWRRRGQLTTVTFTADEAGVLVFRCRAHPPSMIGDLIVLRVADRRDASLVRAGGARPAGDATLPIVGRPGERQRAFAVEA
jgi:hypothetical protein